MTLKDEVAILQSNVTLDALLGELLEWKERYAKVDTPFARGYRQALEVAISLVERERRRDRRAR